MGVGPPRGAQARQKEPEGGSRWGQGGADGDKWEQVGAGGEQVGAGGMGVVHPRGPRPGRRNHR